MKIDWQQNKLTIVGFGIIFVILGVFGYILWNLTREPMAEIPVQDTPVVTTPPIVDKQPEIVKEELPEYLITKVDTTDWENKEFKVGDTGIRYKAPKPSEGNVTRYGLPSEYYLFGVDANIDKSDLFSNYRLTIDALISVNPYGYATGGGSYWLNPIEISVVESKDLSLENIFNVFANEQCKYEILEREFDDYGSLYVAEPKCQTKAQVMGYEYDEKFNGLNVKATITRVEKLKRLDEVTALCVDGGEIEQFKNPFIIQNDANKVTNLIKCNSILGVDNNKNLQTRERELFILALDNNKFAIINYQDTGIPGVSGIEKDNSQKVNNIMHTILSTIEVI